MGMTIEEAIKELIDASHREAKYGDTNNHYYEIMMRIEAFDMAIKVLEQRLEIHDTCKKCIEFSNFEQKPCGDCISRTELLARIDAERKHLLDIKMDGAEHIIVHHARRIIEDMPSVTPSIPDVENNFDIGYNCGYADAMFDIAESEE